MGAEVEELGVLADEVVACAGAGFACGRAADSLLCGTSFL